MAHQSVIAVDLGAESGRIARVDFDGQGLHLEEVHRFPNIPVRAGKTLYWDTLRLWHEISTGLDANLSDACSIGIDAWGVDIALLDRDNNLVGNPVHYRDSRTEGAMQWVFDHVPRRAVFERTGIQFLTLNTLYQFASMVRDKSQLLDIAATAIPLPDLFNFWLTGTLNCEFTHATTWQLYSPRTDDWDWETIRALGIPEKIFPKITPPGTKIGSYKGVPVIAPATHDTASAVVAIPTTTANYAYVSSGTWSLFGMEIPQALINDAAYEANLTNEGGVNGTFRLLKNVMGLWLAQQSRAYWREQGKEYSYDDLTAAARDAEPFRSLVEPDDPSFLPMGNMPLRIQEYCRRTGQPVPETVGQVMRTAYESLALKYRKVLESLIHLTGTKVERLHVIGGGSRNALLNQMSADALGIEVIAGPSEATALGNAIVQLISLGEIGSVAQAREILSRTIGTSTYEPKQTAAWNDAYERFLKLG
jgi:rhamnulokinase